MSTETLLWLFPVVFMIHDFEEIIFFRYWAETRQSILDARVPGLIKRFMRVTFSLSTPAFASAVACLFICLSIYTFLCVEYLWVTLWAAMLALFFVHLLIHILSAIWIRKWIPALITSLAATIYCVYALSSVGNHPLFRMDQFWWSLTLAAILAAFVLVISIRLAQYLDSTFFSPQNQ